METSRSSRQPLTRKQKSRNESVQLADKCRKLSAWKNLNKQLLELKCNEYKVVAKGTQKQLAERLFKHFQEIRNNEILMQDATQLDKTAQETEEAGPSLPISGHENNNINEAGSREQQNAGPSVAELASSVQNLTEIVMGLTKAQGHSGSGERNNVKRKWTHSPSSSSSSPETSDASDSDSPVSVSSNDDNPSHPRSKSASVNKASHDRREENNHGRRGRQHNSPQSPPLSKKATSMHNSRLSHHASSQDGRHSKAHVYDLSDEDEHIPEGLPTLPLQTLKQIRAREFINFNSLLSSTLFSPDSDNIDDLRYKIDFSRKKGFIFKR